MLGLADFKMVECPICYRGWSLDEKELKFLLENKENYNENITCIDGHTFSYMDGIIQDLTSDNSFSEWSFVSDVILHGRANITVGNSYVVNLPIQVPNVNKILLTCVGGYADLSPGVYNSNYFTVVSSSRDNGPNCVPVGSALEINWVVYGRNASLEISSWRKLLVQAKEEIIQGQYNLALLTSEMAFGSFIDTLLYKLMTNKGLPDKAAYTILESINSIYNKVHKLLCHLDGFKFQDEANREVNREWQKLVEKRNKVAHGEVTDSTAEDAKWAFKTVIKGILYILHRSSVKV